ncbi:MAG TPA: iron ABC transporter permease [Candidatus Acidoferrum sp.]|nr:iron ABC transporter permease [Candidatus Acidoferrum sp.]
MTISDIAPATVEPTDVLSSAARRASARSVARRLTTRISVLVLVAVLAVLIIRPLYEILRRAFGNGAQGFHALGAIPGIGRAVQATIWLALGSTVLALVLGVGLAWCAMRLPRGFGWLSIVPVLPIVLPAVASITGWIFIFSPRIGYGNQVLRHLPWWSSRQTGPVDIFTLPWIVIITGLGLSSFVYLFVSAGLRNVNGELIEAAQVSGSSSLGAFFRVMVPTIRPSLVYSTSVCLMLALGQFTAPLLLGSQVGLQVLTTEMYTRITQVPVDFGAAAALGVPLTVVGILFVIGQRFLVGNQQRFVTHGGKSFRPIGKRSRWSAVILVVFGLLAAVLPLIGLAVVALTPFWSGSVDFSRLTTQNFRTTLANPEVTSSIGNSVMFSLWAVVITLPLAFVVASLLVRTRRYRVIRAALDLIVALPLGVPAVMFGVGFLFAYNRPPLQLVGTSKIVVLVYVTLMIPFATRLMVAGMVSLGSAHTEASATCGAGSIYTTVKVTIPMMRAAIGGAAAVTFILLSHEFAASLLVRNFNTNVMGTVLFDAYINGNNGEAAVVGLVMTAVTTIGLAVAMAIGGRRALDAL